jgi:hypothetical protein
VEVIGIGASRLRKNRTQKKKALSLKKKLLTLNFFEMHLLRRLRHLSWQVGFNRPIPYHCYGLALGSHSQAGVGIIFAGIKGKHNLFVDALVPDGPAEVGGQVACHIYAYAPEISSLISLHCCFVASRAIALPP